MIDWMCKPHPITIVNKERAMMVGAWVAEAGCIIKSINENKYFEIHFKSIQAEESYSKAWIL